MTSSDVNNLGLIDACVCACVFAVLCFWLLSVDEILLHLLSVIPCFGLSANSTSKTVVICR